MTYDGDLTTRSIASLNTSVAGFGSGRRRIDQLKELAYDCGLTNDQARIFGKLTATSTWEKLLLAHGLEFEPKPETLHDTVTPASQESARQINLMQWVDWSQALALALASVGLAVMILGLFPRINPLHLPQVKITIQIGDK